MANREALASENDKVSGKECLVCGGSFRNSRIEGLLQCSNCGFQTANLDLSNEQLTALYGEKYFNGDEYASYLADRSAIEKSFARRISRLLPHIPNHGQKTLFEVGCAYGLFLNMARPYFYSVEGIDVSSAALSYARKEFGLHVQCGDLLKAPGPITADVVCLWDTIEHLNNPHLYVERLAKSMPKGGIIAVTTGDIESAVARLRGAKWRQIHPPTHMQYFSRATLTRLLNHYGFKIRYSGYDGMYRSTESMSHILFQLKSHRPILHQTLKRLGLLQFDLYLDLRDILFIIAEKV